MSLLGPKEKGELEGLILARLAEYWDMHGPERLLAPGASVVVDASGPSIAEAPASAATTLASVEIRSLFTALCHLSSDRPGELSRDALAALAAEATAAVATQVNRLAPG